MTTRSSAKLTLISGGKSAAARFEALMAVHYEPLYRAAYRFTRSVQDSEDLVQEVCVRAFPRLTEVEALDQPRHWLMRVLYRLVVDASRRYERRNVDSIETMDTSVLASLEPGVPEQADAVLRKELLDRAWQRLDDAQRMLLALHDIEGYSLAELTEITGLKEGTLKSRLHRARVQLGKLLKYENRVGARLTGVGGSR
jgi:RNA polymerase sigma-70 factor (ECF subfamily)